MLGKRPRPPMKRTTSMTEITFDLGPIPTPSSVLERRHSAAPTSPGIRRRNSIDIVGTAEFLRSCFLCNRRLIPSDDIFMYRGDSAFCSLECRQEQIIHDERKNKCLLASRKQNANNNNNNPSTSRHNSDVSSTGEPAAVAAV